MANPSQGDATHHFAELLYEKTDNLLIFFFHFSYIFPLFSFQIDDILEKVLIFILKHI